MGKGYELTLSSSDISDDSVVGRPLAWMRGSAGERAPGASQVGSAVEELLKAYPNDNPYLAGNQDGACCISPASCPRRCTCRPR